MKLTKAIHILRHVAYVVVTGICIYWFLDNFLGSNHINWFVATVGVLSVVQLFLRVRGVDLALGYILILLSTYMNIAVLSDFIDYMQGDPYRDPWLYFGVGFTMFGSALVLSLCIVMSHFMPLKKPELMEALPQ